MFFKATICTLVQLDMSRIQLYVYLRDFSSLQWWLRSVKIQLISYTDLCLEEHTLHCVSTSVPAFKDTHCTTLIRLQGHTLYYVSTAVIAFNDTHLPHHSNPAIIQQRQTERERDRKTSRNTTSSIQREIKQLTT